MAGRAGASAGAKFTRRHMLRGALAASAAVPLGACGLLSGSQGSEGDGGGNGNLEKTALKVGQLPIIDVAPLHIAADNNYFKEEGLNVELVTAQGSAQTLPQLVAGDLDFTFVDWTSLFGAQAKGAGKFTIVNPGYEAEEGTFTVMTLPDSGIRTPEDLSGKTLAINVFNNVAQLSTKSALQVAGMPGKVKWVELPFPKMPAALQAGQIDAAFLVEPFVTRIKRDLGANVVLETATGPTEGIPIAGYAATNSYLDNNPNTVAAFRRAMDRAQAETTDRALVERTVSRYIKADDQVVKLMSFGTWPTSINKDRLQRVADLMAEFNVLDKPLDVRPLLPESAS